jgi:hypothetical protein
MTAFAADLKVVFHRWKVILIPFLDVLPTDKPTVRSQLPPGLKLRLGFGREIFRFKLTDRDQITALRSLQ